MNKTAESNPGQGRLLLSIHDVGPRFEREVETLFAHLVELTGQRRFAMLVVPNHWGLAPLQKAPAFRRRLREWADEGVEMFVHGWLHRDAEHHAGMARIRASVMTAREGEFLGVDYDDAVRRMSDGKALIEDIIGKPAAGFIAPAWLYGKPALEALKHSGHAIAENHMRVWEPASERVLATGPVITWASRSRSRQLSSLAFAALARKVLQRQKDVRIAVHPGDTGVPAIMRSIARTVSAFACRRVLSRYADLLD